MSLSERETRQAVRYNQRSADDVGWRREYPRIAELLDLDGPSVSEAQLARAVYDWQVAQAPALRPRDGKLGPATWARLRLELDRGVRSTPNTPVPPWLLGAAAARPPIIARAPVAGAGPRWMQVAQEQARRWATEISSWGSERNSVDPETELDWDEAYFAASPRWGEVTHDLGDISDAGNRDWCAAFVNYCLHRAGYSHTGSAGANSFARRWAWHFDALREPRQGCIIVVGDSATGQGAHVAFLDSWRNLPANPDGHVENTAERAFHLLGGNQSGRVVSRRERVLPRRDMLAARGTNGVTSPYLWPRQGPPSCTIGSVIPTEQPHHCHYAPPAR